VKIDENDIAGKLRISWHTVVSMLKKLEEQEMISYLPQSDQPQLQFIRSRVDQLHMDIDVQYIALRKKLQEDQIAAVLAYTSMPVCRSIQLLHYFDEAFADKCGLCDICVAEKRKEDFDVLEERIAFEIATILHADLHTLDELVAAIKSGTDADKLTMIRNLLDNGKIKFDGKNYYL
jgi:ATP-dependent DNA helicase RecQ